MSPTCNLAQLCLKELQYWIVTVHDPSKKSFRMMENVDVIAHQATQDAIGLNEEWNIFRCQIESKYL